MPLRSYQEDAIGELARHWVKSSDPCILQLATGAGKSWIISEIVHRSGQPTLVLQPTKEILEQNYEKLLAAGVPASEIAVCSASAGKWEVGKITLATIGTIKSHVEYCQHFKVVVIDEADVVPVDRADSMYIKFLDKLNPRARIVGLTATPWRNQAFAKRFEDPKVFCRPLTRIHMQGGGKTRFGEWFWKGGIIYQCDIQYLQENGYLLDTIYHIAEADWSFVRDVAGRVDYDTDQMTRFMDIEANTSRFTQAITWCMKKGLKTIIFSPNIDMNFRLESCVEALGGTVECMDSENDSKRSRAEKMDRFRNGKFQFLINVGMVGRGVDVPSVDCVLMCRPTKSLSLYLQYVGRCLRVDPDQPDKKAVVLDLAGNHERFGGVEGVKLCKVDKPNKYGGVSVVDAITIEKEGKTQIWDQVK